MNIIYTLTTVLILVLHILIYKKEEKENIIKWIAISIMLLFCYNICISVIMSLIHIPINLLSLTIINIIILLLLSIKIYKNKKIQKYTINKIDIIGIIIFSLITLIVVIKEYGIPLNMNNSITDGAVHYFAADEFYKSSKLLDKNSETFNFWNFSTFMPGAYINTGILFKMFSGIIDEIYFCKLYLILNVFFWYLSGILMYVLLSKDKKQEKQKILPLIFSLVYMLAYPLNSLIAGFSYLSLALNFIITILIVTQLEINNYYKYVIMFLLNFGLFFSYYYFLPVVYVALFLQIIIDAKKNKNKIFDKENIVNVIYTLLFPGLFGLMYFEIFPLITASQNPISETVVVLGIKGSIYSNFITNILIFLVLSICQIIYNLKNKKTNISETMLILNLIFLTIIFIGMKSNIVSSYYYYKLYYLIWIFVLIVGYNMIETIISKRKITKIVAYILTTIYCLGIIIAMCFNKNFIFFDIYKENRNNLNSEIKIIYEEELEVIKYYNENINIDKHKDSKTYFCVTPYEAARAYWIYALTKNPFDYIDVSYGEYAYDLKWFIESENNYAVIFKEDYFGNFDEIDKEIEKEDVKILFRNKMGIILEKN